LIGDETHAGVGKSTREKLPEEKSRVNEDWVGYAVGGHFCEIAEEDGEDDHGHNRLKDRPRRAESGLFVTDFQVAPGEEIQKFFILPDFFQIIPAEDFFWFDDCCLHDTNEDTNIRILQRITNIRMATNTDDGSLICLFYAILAIFSTEKPHPYIKRWILMESHTV